MWNLVPWAFRGSESPAPVASGEIPNATAEFFIVFVCLLVGG